MLIYIFLSILVFGKLHFDTPAWKGGNSLSEYLDKSIMDKCYTILDCIRYFSTCIISNRVDHVTGVEINSELFEESINCLKDLKGYNKVDEVSRRLEEKLIKETASGTRILVLIPGTEEKDRCTVGRKGLSYKIIDNRHGPCGISYRAYGKDDTIN